MKAVVCISLIVFIITVVALAGSSRNGDRMIIQFLKDAEVSDSLIKAVLLMPRALTLNPRTHKPLPGEQLQIGPNYESMVIITFDTNGCTTSRLLYDYSEMMRQKSGY